MHALNDTQADSLRQEPVVLSTVRQPSDSEAPREPSKDAPEGDRPKPFLRALLLAFAAWTA